MSDSGARSRTAHLKEHQFRPGVSPNPGGRPKASAAVAKLIREKTQDCTELVDLVLNIARGLESGMDDSKSRAWAISMLFDRGIGKAPMIIETSDGREAAPRGKLSKEEFATLSKLDNVVGLEVTMDEVADDDSEDEPEDVAPEPTNGDGPAGPN